MRYVEYGKTGKQVSVIGFGAMRFDLSKPNEYSAEVVHHASSKGINYFDTAPGYERSEDIFGIAFKQMPAPYYVSTKCMPEAAPTADLTREAVKKSLGRMGIPKIHFFHVWCLRAQSQFDLAMQPGGMYDGLLKCKADGLVDHIVFSSHQPGETIKRQLATGKYEGVLLGCNVLNFPYRWDAVDAAAKMGVGVVAMNPLSGGMIPKSEKELAWLAGPNETPTQAALRFVLSCPQITVSLVGFTTKEQVDFACNVVDKAAPMSAADIDRIRKRLGENMNHICTTCGYCKGCPQGINVATYMQWYNSKVMFNRSDEAMQQSIPFDSKWGILTDCATKSVNCSECGQCEQKCTQQLDIIDRLKKIAEWEAKVC